MATGDMHTTWDDGQGQWKNQREGSSRASGYYDRKDEASEAGKTTMRREGGEWFGHKKDDGQINERDTYGDDPHPPKG